MVTESIGGLPPYIFTDIDGSFDQELYDILGKPGYSNNRIPEDDCIPENDVIPGAKAYFSPRLSPQDFLTLAKLDYEDIKNKNIVDIGGGAGCLALLLENEAHPQKIEIVDPIFAEYPFEKVVLQAAKNLKGLSKTKGSQTENQIKSKEVLEKYLQKKYSLGSIKINPSYGDHIHGIVSGSQDIVFINHLLHKLEKEEGIKILAEANRLLKENGEIIIIEYPESSRIVDQSNDYIISQNKDALCIKFKKNERENFLEEKNP